MKKNVISWALLAGMVLALGASMSACTGDDDDDGSSGQPVLTLDGGGVPNFTTCAAVGTGGGLITVKVLVGEQSIDPSAVPEPTAGASVVQYNPATGTTSGTAGITGATGEAIVSVPSNARVAFKVTHPDDGTVTFVPAYDYTHDTPATTSTNGAPVFSLRIIPTTVRNAIAAVIGPPVASLAGTMQFAGSVNDCNGDAIVGATLLVNGAAPPKCSGSSALPCVAYTTSTALDYTDDSGSIFVLGLPGASDSTIEVQGILVDGGALTTVGTISLNGEADGIALGGVPAQNVP